MRVTKHFCQICYRYPFFNTVSGEGMSQCEGVSTRLRKGGFLAMVIDFSYRTTELHWASHQRKLSYATDITQEIQNVSYELYKESGTLPLRSIGVRATGLIPCTTPEQIDFFADVEKRDRQRAIDSTLDGLRERFGYDSIQRGTRYMDSDLGKLNALRHTVHPAGYQG